MAENLPWTGVCLFGASLVPRFRWQFIGKCNSGIGISLEAQGFFRIRGNPPVIISPTPSLELPCPVNFLLVSSTDRCPFHRHKIPLSTGHPLLRIWQLQSLLRSLLQSPLQDCVNARKPLSQEFPGVFEEKSYGAYTITVVLPPTFSSSSRTSHPCCHCFRHCFPILAFSITSRSFSGTSGS